MPNTVYNYRYPPLSMESVLRFAFLSEASGFLGVVTKVFRGTCGSRPPGALSLAVLSSGPMVFATEAQPVINFPRGFTGGTGHITLENPLVGGSIYLNLSRGEWTF
jgi:hypothetical protein